MAKPIGDTPTLRGKEASDFLNKMVEPLTKKDKEFKKKYDAAKRYHSRTLKSRYR